MRAGLLQLVEGAEGLVDGGAELAGGRAALVSAHGGPEPRWTQDQLAEPEFAKEKKRHGPEPGLFSRQFG